MLALLAKIVNSYEHDESWEVSLQSWVEGTPGLHISVAQGWVAADDTSFLQNVHEHYYSRSILVDILALSPSSLSGKIEQTLGSYTSSTFMEKVEWKKEQKLSTATSRVNLFIGSRRERPLDTRRMLLRICYWVKPHMIHSFLCDADGGSELAVLHQKPRFCWMRRGSC